MNCVNCKKLSSELIEFKVQSILDSKVIRSKYEQLIWNERKNTKILYKQVDLLKDEVKLTNQMNNDLFKCLSNVLKKQNDETSILLTKYKMMVENLKGTNSQLSTDDQRGLALYHNPESHRHNTSHRRNSI